MQSQPTLPRLMLYLEWILLGLTAFSTIVAALIDVPSKFPFTTVLCIGLLVVLGLRAHKNKRLHKIGFTLLEFVLLVLPHMAGDRVINFPVLGVVLVLRSAQRFNRTGRYAIAVGVYLLEILILFTRDGVPLGAPDKAFGIFQTIPKTPLNILILKLIVTVYFGMMLILVLILINSLISERQNQKYLSATLTQLRQYSLRIEDQAALQERNRIAREIHDSLGHTLTAQSVQLESGLLLLNSAKPEQASSFFNAAKSLCTQALQEVRQSVSMLHSDCLLGNSLERAIATLLRDFQTTTAIVPEVKIDIPQTLPSELSSTVYRIVQAALTNIVRHSAATEITLQLTAHDRTLYLVIKDNGRGFDPAQNSTGFGIQGMYERTLNLDGQFHLFSEPGAGCLITIQIPLPRLLP